jgi:hypothetical protein
MIASAEARRAAKEAIEDAEFEVVVEAAAAAGDASERPLAEAAE